MATEKVSVTHHVTFNKERFPYQTIPVSLPSHSGYSPDLHWNKEETEDLTITVLPVPAVPEVPTAPTHVTPVSPTVQSQVQDGLTTLKRSSRLKDSNVDYRGMSSSLYKVFHIVDTFDCLPETFKATMSDYSVPKSFQKAVEGPEGQKWRDVCHKEINSMHSKNVWKLVPRPDSRKIIRGLWPFKRKMGADSTVIKYKS